MTTLFADRASQPVRACLIFCRLNNLDVEEKTVQILKGEHVKPPFSELSPLKKLPVLKDGDFVLPESAAILRYLAAKYNVPDHWYPRDFKARAKVDAALDWHHGNLRRGSAGLMFQKVLGPVRGQPPVKELVKDSENALHQSLKAMENYWLARSEFAAGDQISIADLLWATELEQLEYLDATDGPHMAEILEPYPRVRAWLDRVRRTTAPVYDDVHQLMHKAVARFKQMSARPKL